MERQKLSLGRWQDAVDRSLRDLAGRDAVIRLWDRDPTLWKDDPTHQAEISQRLGWLTVAGAMRSQLPELEVFRQEVVRDGIEQVILCGMGGSSLCPELLRLTFGSAPGFPRLWVLDSTDPEMVSRVAQQADPARTLHLISSKSGGTIEVDSLYRFFFDRAEAQMGDDAGSAFAAVTDPGTSLERLGAERRFRRVFLNPPDIGGRYSALSLFGLVPAALIGLDLNLLLDDAERMAQACSRSTPTDRNPGLWLGAALGEMAGVGRDKLTLLSSPRLGSFGLWVEQLIAESTGKEGRGIVPLAGEPLAPPESYGEDRFFVYTRLEGDDNAALDQLVARLETLGHPVVTFLLDGEYDLSGEFFRWEFATALAGALLKIDPFDQPNVQESKDNTKRLLDLYRERGSLPVEEPDLVQGDLELRGTEAGTVAGALAAFLDQAREGDYLALMAYLDMAEPMDRALEGLRRRLLERTRLATTLGYGPRFLHSTGQIHKGGPDSGLFLQITADKQARVPIPGQPYDFGTLQAAQALGDRQALRQHGRRVLAIHLGGDVLEGLVRLTQAVG
ncbi:MAG: glucose-6-phosphate isomerase [Chloroflexota bacterium]